MNAVETDHLSKSYGRKEALRDLDLTIAHGELFSLLGVNGAGKTTTIKLLSGLAKPTSGSVRIYGLDILADSQRVKALTGVSPQETAVAANLTVQENLELIAGIYGADRRAAKQQAEALIREFKMTEVASVKAKKLSGGWQRRLSIAMALISKPKLLFLDEPTLGLDILARRELWQILQQLKGSITMILTTHYLEEAEALSDRIGILTAGNLTAVGTPQELMDKTKTARFEEAFIALAGGSGI